MKHCQALVFDLDDTLYPESEFVLSGFVAVDDWLVQHTRHAGFNEIAVSLFRAGRRGTIFNETLAQLGVDDPGPLVAEMVEVYRAHQPRLTLFPDAAAALATFGDKWALGLITDGYARTQRNKVAALGLARQLDALIYTDELGREHWKPSPLAFERIENDLSVPGTRCMYIGDNPRKDFAAPKRLGWTTVRIRRPRGEHHGVGSADVPEISRPDHEIASLSELALVLP